MSDIVLISATPTELFGNEILSEIDLAVATGKSITHVSCDSDARSASAAIDELKSVRKVIESRRKEFTRKIDSVKKSIMQVEKTCSEDIESELSRIQSLVCSYIAEVNSRREAENKAELARIEKAAADDVEKAELFGDEVEACATTSPVQERNAPLVAGVKTRTTWSFEITDPNSVPRQYCTPDDKLIREYVDAMKKGGAHIDDLCVAGVRFFVKTTVV